MRFIQKQNKNQLVDDKCGGTEYKEALRKR
jgi:hypothetical protein